MSIVRCTAYPFRYAEEAYAESADEADALELFDSSLYTGMFSIDFDREAARGEAAKKQKQGKADGGGAFAGAMEKAPVFEEGGLLLAG